PATSPVSLHDALPICFPGWKCTTAGIASLEGLPARAKSYVAALEEIVGAKVALLSTGPRREETIVQRGTALDEWLDRAVPASARSEEHTSELQSLRHL